MRVGPLSLWPSLITPTSPARLLLHGDLVLTLLRRLRLRPPWTSSSRRRHRHCHRHGPPCRSVAGDVDDGRSTHRRHQPNGHHLLPTSEPFAIVVVPPDMTYQPHHTSSGGARPRGQVYGYRMSLWEEHLGKLALTPDSMECFRLVNRVAREKLERYADEEKVIALQGHLMRYPVEVSVDGKVGPLPGHEVFPDVGGRVLESPNKYADYLTM